MVVMDNLVVLQDGPDGRWNGWVGEITDGGTIPESNKVWLRPVIEPRPDGYAEPFVWPKDKMTPVSDDPVLARLVRAAIERPERQVEERYAALVNAHEDFKREVAEVAVKYAKEHDWCSVVRDALDELGLEVPTETHTYSVSGTITVEVDPLARYGPQDSVNGAKVEFDSDMDYLEIEIDGLDLERIDY